MQHNIIPISSQAALLQELQYLKEEVAILRATLAGKNSRDTNQEECVFLRTGKTIRRTAISDIVMVKAESNYSMIYLSDGTQILTSRTIKHWTAKMSIYPCMIRVHRTYLINGKHIHAFKSNTFELLLTNGLKARCSRSFRPDIMELMKKNGKTET